MSPVNQINRLRDFLEHNTGLYEETFLNVAKAKYEKARRLADIGSLNQYILVNEKQIQEETKNVLENMAREIIAHNQYKYLFSQLSLFSLFLLPPIYPLVRYAVKIWLAAPLDLVEFSLCVAGICLLLVMIGASAYAVFTTSFQKK